MDAQVLLVGAMGHIGGAVLDQLVQAHPDLPITALVRSRKDADILAKQYAHAKVKQAIGTLDDTALLEDLAGEANIVINCGPDVIYGAGITALLRGQSAQQTHTFYIGTTGAASGWDAPTGRGGARIWDDVANIDELLAQPDSVTHIATDKLVLAANSPQLHTALVSPCFVAGVSPSQTHPTPLVYPDWLGVMEAVGGGLVIAEGANRTSFVDVKHLAGLYVRLVGDALSQLREEGSRPFTTAEGVQIWGPRAYYFGVNGEMTLRELMEDHMVPSLEKHGVPWLKTKEIQEVSLDRITEAIFARLGGVEGAELWSSHLAEAFGVNMRVKGTRAEKALGYVWDGSGDSGIGESLAVFLGK
ncbi:hypothetical protein B0T19DRAFT_231973 [Cercophora scortea]|uniref:Saccharopine dehydrogenase NADP binding domain-containing protein n=1 Tax=Cercophora scortea TaxID=314031 RepID=A0AAE0MAG6_9PEZI|nr:hypothetical protein B0T19DRAFT_231973 [Cercophora scortea]